MPFIEQIRQALTQVIDPELERNIVELGMLREIQVNGGDVTITLALTIMGCPFRNQLKDQTQKAAAAVPGVENVIVELTAMNDEERKRLQERQQPSTGLAFRASQFNRVQRLIAVISGKGGVGKSSVTALLAVALQRLGYAVGVLDADLTGPSIPRLFGISGPVEGTPFGIVPVETRSGIKVISTNLMLPKEDMAITWRGPVMSGAIRQFWNDVIWGQLDYLLLDLPPGTSDATLTVMQSLPLNGVIMVTMPQGLSSMVVRKTVDMSQIMKVPILGIVENMAYFTSPETGSRYEIFGPSHCGEVAQAAQAPILGCLPIDPDLTRLADTGEIEQYEHSAYAELAAAFVEVTALFDAADAELAPTESAMD